MAVIKAKFKVDKEQLGLEKADEKFNSKNVIPTDVSFIDVKNINQVLKKVFI